MKLDTSASGVYSIAPTPFLENGAIDWNSVDRMTDFYFEAGCNGFTILGVDHFMDMGRTCTNTVATAIAAASVAKWEGDKLALALPAPAS